VGAPSPDALAAVERMLGHYEMVAHPQTLQTMFLTLLEGGWLPVIAAVAPSGELHVLGPSAAQTTQKILSRALRLAGRPS
jgi:hypothetical protein